MSEQVRGQWALLRDAEAWTGFAFICKAQLGDTGTFQAGDGPREFPCLVGTTIAKRANGATLAVPAFVYLADARTLVAAATPAASALDLTGPMQELATGLQQMLAEQKQNSEAPNAERDALKAKLLAQMTKKE